MLINNLLQLVALASLATASAIARTTGPVTEYADISSLNPAANTSSNALVARQTVIDIYCGCGIGLDATYTNDVVAKMSEGTIEVGTERATIWLNPWTANLVWEGNVVAFTCNMGGISRGILGVQFKIAVQQQVSPVCGSFIAGTWKDGDILLGYMRYNGESAAYICAAALYSSAIWGINENNDLKYIC